MSGIGFFWLIVAMSCLVLMFSEDDGVDVDEDEGYGDDD